MTRRSSLKNQPLPRMREHFTAFAWRAFLMLIICVLGYAFLLISPTYLPLSTFYGTFKGVQRVFSSTCQVYILEPVHSIPTKKHQSNRLKSSYHRTHKRGSQQYAVQSLEMEWSSAHPLDNLEEMENLLFKEYQEKIGHPAPLLTYPGEQLQHKLYERMHHLFRQPQPSLSAYRYWQWYDLSLLASCPLSEELESLCGLKEEEVADYIVSLGGTSLNKKTVPQPNKVYLIVPLPKHK